MPEPASKIFSINIFSTAKNIIVTELCTRELAQTDAQNITIFAPPGDIKEFNKKFSQTIEKFSDRVKILPDDELDPHGNYRNFLSNQLENRREKLGWYYQQFLKIKSASISDTPIWIIDGDTFFTSTFISRLTNGNYIACSKEDVTHYNKSLLSFMPELNIASNNSYIANGGFIQPSILNHFLRGSTPEEIFTLWVDEILKSDYKDISEYQLFGNIMKGVGYEDIFARFYRRADLLIDGEKDEYYVINKLKKSYDIIAFESNHKSNFFRRLAAKVLVKIKYSW